VIKSKRTPKLKHADSTLEYFEYFCQMSSKWIHIISSYTVSKFTRFFETQCSTHTCKTHMIPGSRETHKTQSISLVCAVLIDRSAAYICRNIAKLFFLIFVTPENSQAHLYHWLYTFVSALFCQFLCPTLAATALLVFMFYCFYNLQEANRPLVGLLIIISCLSGAVVLRS